MLSVWVPQSARVRSERMALLSIPWTSMATSFASVSEKVKTASGPASSDDEPQTVS